ncbi:peptidase family M1-domain-containing protein [Obelidium mucronatum]|nr:peptidase family M1-domain-containing protein [Obelidium mucronatum]
MCLCHTDDLNGGTSSKQNSDREILPTNVAPVNYSVWLRPSLATFEFKGKVSIALKVAAESTQIVLNSKGLEINSAAVSFAGSKYTATIATNADTETATFTFNEMIQIGSAVLECEFSGIHKDQLSGFYRSSYNDELGKECYLLSTQCCATDCRQVFPCFDEPSLKATFDYTFVVDESLVVLTNMNEISCVKLDGVNGTKLKEVKFATTPLMSTYLVAFVIGDLECIEAVALPNIPADSRPITVRVFTTKGLVEQGRFALNVAVKTLVYFNEYFNIAYPLPKSDLVAIPNFGFGAMENWGLITYRTTALLCNEHTATSAAKKQIAYTVAHELAHQWFGNLVTMDWWNDLWLNEGFATFVGWLAIDYLFPEWDVWTGYLTGVLAGALNLDGLRSSHPIDVPVQSGSQALQVLDAISYLKGSSIIRMLKEFLGDDVFMNGVRSYLQEFKYRNTVTSDLWKHLSLASGKDIAALMHSWINEMGYPLVTVESECFNPEDNTMTVQLSQSHFLSELQPEEDKVTWWVPITVVTHATANGPPSSHVLSEKRGAITFPYEISGASFWKLNYGASGMYRVKYSDSHSAAIAQALQNKPTRFSVADRIMFISDSFSLVTAGLTDISSVLNLIKALEKDQDYHVLSQISTTLMSLKSATYLESEAVQQGLKALGRSVFSSKALESGFDYPESEDHFDRLKRGLVISAAASFGDDHVNKELRIRFDKFIAGDKGALHPELRSVAFNSVLSNAPQDEVAVLLDNLLDIYKDSSTQAKEKSDILGVIGAANSSLVVDRVLNKIMFDTSIVRTQDFSIPLNGVAGVGKSRLALLTWMMTNWKRICCLFEGSEMRLGSVFSACVGSCVGQSLISEVESWLRGDSLDPEANRAHQKVFVHFSRTIDQTLESMRTKTRWVSRAQKSLEEWAAAV